MKMMNSTMALIDSLPLKPITKKVKTGVKAKDPKGKREEFFKSGDKKLPISPAKLLKQKAQRKKVREVLQMIKRDMGKDGCKDFIYSCPECELLLTYQLLESYYFSYLP